MDSGVDAVVLQVPPYSFPGLAENALDRGLHIYMAKPVAIDIYGTLQIQRLKSRATAEKKVFLADYQLPRDPVNQEVAKRIQAGALGKIQMIFSSGWAGGNGYQDPPKEKGAASRLKDLVWSTTLRSAAITSFITMYTFSTPSCGRWASAPSAQWARPRPSVPPYTATRRTPPP